MIITDRTVKEKQRENQKTMISINIKIKWIK